MKPQHYSTPINSIMPSAVNTPSGSAAIESLNHLSGSSLSHNRISTVGRDLHETHNHYYRTPDGHRQARTDRGVFGRLLMGIMETLQEATSEFGSMVRTFTSSPPQSAQSSLGTRIPRDDQNSE